MPLRWNVLANYLGQGWTAVMGLAFVPLYIKYMGIESYGLIGLLAVIQAWMVLLDMGMGPSLGREMGRFTGGIGSVQSVRDLLKSVEIATVCIAIFAIVLIWMLSGWLASNWIHTKDLSTDTVAMAFAIMGIVAAMRFVENIYRSALIGLQKQVLLNVIGSVIATLRGGGSVAVLVWISPSVEAFFVWQGIASGISVVCLALAVYTSIPHSERSARFSSKALREIWEFARGMVGITILTLLLTQIDKLLLPKILGLAEFGYYVFAAVIAGSLYMIITPITQAFYPRFNELIAKKDQSNLVCSFHLSAQLVSVILGTVAIFLMVFSEPILLVWTQDGIVSEKVAPLVKLLALGTLLNGLMWIPYQMQLAHGWTKLTIYINLISVALIVPAIIILTPIYGAEGAAWIRVVLNGAYVLVGAHMMYKKMYFLEKWEWYISDVTGPIASASVVAIILGQIIPSDMGLVAMGGYLSLSILFIGVASLIAAPLIRIRTWEKVRILTSRFI